MYINNATKKIMEESIEVQQLGVVKKYYKSTGT